MAKHKEPFQKKHFMRQWGLVLFLMAISGLSTMAQQSVEHSLIPSRPPSSREMDSSASAFPANRQVIEVRFRLDHGKIVVPVRVNGSEPLDFVLDTGANLAFLVDGRNVQNPAFEIIGEARVQGAGVGAEIPTEVAGNVTFSLGDVELRGNRMALGSGGTGVLAGTGWDGIFGRQVFENLVVEIDWDAEVLRFHNPKKYKVPSGASILPLVFERGHAFVQAEIAVEAGSLTSIHVVLDTGASHALALATGSQGVRPPAQRIEHALLGRGLSGEIRGTLGRIHQIRLGDFVLENVLTSFPEKNLVPIITSQRDGNLGSEILRRFTTTFDYARKRLILVANEQFAEPFDFSTAGFRTHHNLTDGESAEVDDVYPHSPAARAGIQVGDRILAINGRAVQDMGTEQLGRLLRRSPGTVLRVRFARGQKVREVELRLESLL